MPGGSLGTRVCGVFNIIAGGVAAFVGSLLAYTEGTLTWGFRFNTAVMIWLFLATAGALFSLSGLFMLRSSVAAPRAALVLLGLAVLFGLFFSVSFMVKYWDSINPGDPFIFWYQQGILFLPIVVTLIGLLELLYIWRKRTE